MNLISKEELKEKLDRGDDFKLVNTLSIFAFEAKHIPGSLHIDTKEKALEELSPDDEIVVYCTNEACMASQYAYHLLEQHDFANIKRYAGGVQDWESAGYPLEGKEFSNQ